MIPKPEPSTSIAALIAMKYWMPSRTKQSAGMSSIRLTFAKPQSQNSNPTTNTHIVMTIQQAYIQHKNQCLLTGEKPMTELEFTQFAAELISNHNTMLKGGK